VPWFLPAQALVYFEYVFADTDEEQVAVDQLKLLCLLNHAASKIKTEEYGEAHNSCSEVRIRRGLLVVVVVVVVVVVATSHTLALTAHVYCSSMRYREVRSAFCGGRVPRTSSQQVALCVVHAHTHTHGTMVERPYFNRTHASTLSLSLSLSRMHSLHRLDTTHPFKRY
jgi:hypothetical protein